MKEKHFQLTYLDVFPFWERPKRERLGIKMTEEINNINTDLKDLFVKQQYEEMITLLDGLEDAVALEIAMFNHEVIEKYYNTERFDLIRQYLTFVAYTSFVFEYAVKRQLLADDVAEEKNKLYTNIFEMLRA